jgi:hypothetical protein
MHVLTQLSPPIRIITPLGDAVAYFLWTEDRAVYWGVFQDETGEQWWFENYFIRIDPSITDTPHKTSRIEMPADMEAALSKHRCRYTSRAERDRFGNVGL